MRMWNVPTEIMCRQHLLGEHNEVHMMIGTLNKGISVNGYIEKGLLEIHFLTKRHKKLKEEMERRGYCHNSPLPPFKSKKLGKIDIKANIKELSKRCKECKRLQNESK